MTHDEFSSLPILKDRQCKPGQLIVWGHREKPDSYKIGLISSLCIENNRKILYMVGRPEVTVYLRNFDNKRRADRRGEQKGMIRKDASHFIRLAVPRILSDTV